MKKIEHSKRAHALLSASGASRWMACTPSARLEDEYGEKKTSDYAVEGTLAHELAELYIRKDILENISDDDFSSKLEEIMADSHFTEDMLEYVSVYTDYCEQQFIAAKSENMFAELQVEQKFDLAEYVPESFGTGDSCIISEPVLEIVDLKYGKGVPVYAEWNKQLLLYAIGALRKYDTMYNIEQVRLTIVQPRLNNISSFEISVEDIRDWAETELRPKAQLAFAGQGELVAGDHCKFCSVKNRCKKLYEYNFEIAKHEFKDARLLTDEEVVDILKRAPQLTEWANSVLVYAQDKAINENKEWPGYKLVEGRSIRKWVDEDLALNTIFARLPELSEDQVLETKLCSLTAIEKLIGKKKFAEVLNDVVIKPEGKPVLVPESDKRPAMGLSQAVKDFS